MHSSDRNPMVFEFGLGILGLVERPPRGHRKGAVIRRYSHSVGIFPEQLDMRPVVDWEREPTVPPGEDSRWHDTQVSGLPCISLSRVLCDVKSRTPPNLKHKCWMDQVESVSSPQTLCMQERAFNVISVKFGLSVDISNITPGRWSCHLRGSRRARLVVRFEVVTSLGGARDRYRGGMCRRATGTLFPFGIGGSKLL